MKVLFIYSLCSIASASKPLRSPEWIQFGISYISAILKQNGHSTKLIILSRISGEKNKNIIDKYINEFKPELVCFTSVSSEYSFVVEIARYIRSNYPDLFLLIGGAHVSLNPEGALNDFDALCIGEGEYPVLELVSSIEENKPPQSIPNLWIKHDDKIEKNPSRPFISDLDVLPFPDRDMWQEWIKEDASARHTVLLGRGCPFNCSYCSNHALRKIASGTYVRYRSPDNIISEINELVDKYPQKTEIYLEVETIGVNKSWTLELCSKLRSFNQAHKNQIHFGANLRIVPNVNYRDIFHALKNANFRFINIGLESGSEKIRREILRRNYSNADIINAVKLAREYGLQVSFFNMVGLPGETVDDFHETIEMNKICLPDWINFSIFYPYPGTDLYTFCKAKGYLGDSIDTRMERGRAILNLPYFSKKEVEHNYIWFNYNVYKGHKPLIRLLSQALKLQIRANPFLFAVYSYFKYIAAKMLNVAIKMLI
ncbi:MAG: radical SAM protein [Candidatus Saganbacteria bacterium]|nr:radical SAM protein [Candidatus Saganbacteria bacterium]